MLFFFKLLILNILSFLGPFLGRARTEYLQQFTLGLQKTIFWTLG